MKDVSVVKGDFVNVAIVLLNWNCWHDTVACLNSIASSNLANINYRVIVCDNGSTDNSLSYIINWAEKAIPSNWLLLDKTNFFEYENKSEKFIFIDNKENLGFAGGCNIGIQFSLEQLNPQFIWLLNNDTEIDSYAIKNLLAYINSDHTIAICGSTLIYYSEPRKIQAFGGSIYNKYLGRSKHIGAFSAIEEIPSRVDVKNIEASYSYIVGAAMMVRSEVFKQVGLLSEDYFLYFEELDFVSKLPKSWRLGYAADSIVYHKEGASIGTSSSGGSPLSIYFLLRNRILFTKKFYPYCLPSVFIFTGWEIFKFLLKRRLPLVKSGLKAIRDGLKNNKGGKCIF